MLLLKPPPARPFTRLTTHRMALTSTFYRPARWLSGFVWRVGLEWLRDFVAVPLAFLISFLIFRNHFTFNEIKAAAPHIAQVVVGTVAILRLFFRRRRITVASRDDDAAE